MKICKWDLLPHKLSFSAFTSGSQLQTHMRIVEQKFSERLICIMNDQIFCAMSFFIVWG